MRRTSQLFIATITAGFVLAPLSLAWGQYGGNRQIGSPTRDSNAGLGTRSTNSSTRRMNAGTTQQRLGNPLGGSSNFDSGPRRTLFGNSGSAAGGRPRNTTLNPAAKDPIARNPALLDPVTGVQETGPVQRSGVFDSTGRSFVDPTHVNDAAFADQINPAAAPIGGDTLGIDNIISNPSTANLNRGDELHDFSDSSAAATITDGAADQSGSANSGPPLTNTAPNAPAVTGSTAGASLGAAANRKMRNDPLLFSNRRLLAQRLGLGFDPNNQNLTLATVPVGTWADRIGFQPGDRIVAIGGQTVYGYRDLANFLTTHLAGRTTIDVERNGQVEQLQLNLGSLTRRLQVSEPTVRLQVTDSTAAVTASGRRITGTAAEAVRAARLRAEQQQLQKSPER